MSQSPATTPKSRVRSIWDRAQMFIAFHRDPARKKRAEPYLWPPKDAAAGLRAETDDQETFVHMRGTDRADDVQLKLRTNAIIARRDPGRGWSGVEINDQSVRVLVGDVWITIDQMGTVKREADDGASTTFLEFDGSIIQLTEGAEVCVSADGAEITRRTADRIEGLTPDGVVSRQRQIEGAGR
ncbi:hypothetical protein [Jannaschia sp. LMIT008]|uniref:hypothetical protein n=1 Tax=Jannaschia maritima TaxID=3032585 RepID=UPI0028117723|nr:hypothetical protein [Jannaschia sp. LMIT008]